MRNLVWCLLAFAFLCSGCLKKEDGCDPNNAVAPAAEVQAVADYLSNYGINATKHGSGVYYSILASGQGNIPTVCSTIKVDYTGTLTNGTQFETNSDILLNLKFLIPGWQIGLPLIMPGGRMKLYIPPTLGYGNQDKKDDQGNIKIPANSILIYDISLTSVQ